MKRFLILLTVFFINLAVISSAWASYTSHSQSGNWQYNGWIDDRSYASTYCYLQLPVNSPDRCDGSLTEVTLTVKCTSVSYHTNWCLEIYYSGRWVGWEGGVHAGIKIAEISGTGSNPVTATISIPDEGWNGLGFRNKYTEDYYEITVTHIKYRRYTVDGFEPIITLDRYVFLSVIQNTPVNNMRYVITRSPGGHRYYNGDTDNNVDPEKYYYYSLYYGFNMDTPTGSTPAITKKVKIPSDATDAKASADAAKTKAQDAKLAADAARDAANAAAGDTNYIRNTQLPNLENKIANLETTVNNINNNITGDNMSPIVKVQTVSGARATSANSISCIVSVTDNSTGPFEYRVNGGTWSALPSSSQVSLPVTQSGMNSIIVEVRDPSGNIGKDVITIRKL